MERDPQKVSAVLGDPTRYRIYQHVLRSQGPVSVAEAAKQFGLHANVARMHLGKLVDIGLLSAHSEKTGRGGRPGYVYTPSGNAVSLSVPARDFQLLADLLVQSLALIGDGGQEAVAQIGRAFGRRLGNEAKSRSVSGQAAGEDPLKTCAEALQRLGLAAHVTAGEGGLTLKLRGCGFQEVATAHPQFVCKMCHALVEGVTEACTEATPHVAQTGSIPRGDRECVYEVDPH